MAAVRADSLKEDPAQGGAYYALHIRRGDFQVRPFSSLALASDAWAHLNLLCTTPRPSFAVPAAPRCVQYKDVKLSAEDILKNLHFPNGTAIMPPGSMVYLSTDDPQVTQHLEPYETRRLSPAPCLTHAARTPIPPYFLHPTGRVRELLREPAAVQLLRRGQQARGLPGGPLLGRLRQVRLETALPRGLPPERSRWLSPTSSLLRFSFSLLPALPQGCSRA